MKVSIGNLRKYVLSELIRLNNAKQAKSDSYGMGSYFSPQYYDGAIRTLEELSINFHLGIKDWRKYEIIK